MVLVCVAAIEPDDGIQVFQLPFAPLIESAIYHRIIIAGVDEQNVVQQFFPLALIEEPKGARQALGIKEVVADTDHHIHMAGLYQLLADVLVFSLAVRGGGGHHKTSPAMLVQVRVKIGDPEIVCIADLFVLVDSRHSKR